MVYNFSAGPSALPKAVMQKAAAEFTNFQGSGVSVMEVSHRSALFESVHNTALSNLRTLLQVPENYEILFLQGGAQGENAIVPLNLCGQSQQADMVVNGRWSHLTAQESGRMVDVHIAAQSDTKSYPDPNSWRTRSSSAYVHVCSNETVNGIESMALPLNCDIPIVADMSSNLLSRPFDVGRYGVIYAGAQKNIACAGLTVVIVRKDLLNQSMPQCPIVFQWQAQAQSNSLYNTPPTFAIYMAGLVFEWLLQCGGLAEIEKANIAKAELLYQFIDASGFYTNDVEQAFRSRMNVPFFLPNEALTSAFLETCEAQGLRYLKGHKAVGGVRASIYNAMPLAGVKRLIEVMERFQKGHSQ